MKRFAIAILLVAACSGKSKHGTTGTGSGSEAAVVYGKKIVVSWGIQKQASSAEVFLETTDETGHQVSHAVGTFPGECTVIQPAETMKALSGVACKTGGSGTEIHAVANDP